MSDFSEKMAAHLAKLEASDRLRGERASNLPLPGVALMAYRAGIVTYRTVTRAGEVSEARTLHACVLAAELRSGGLILGRGHRGKHEVRALKAAMAYADRRNKANNNKARDLATMEA